MRGKLIACFIAAGVPILLPAHAHALTDLDLEHMQSQIDDLEDDMVERRVERIEREQEAQQRRSDRQVEQWRRDQDHALQRCLRANVCPRPSKPEASTQPPQTDTLASSQAIRDYDAYVTRNMTPKERAAYQQKSERDYEIMLRNLRVTASQIR